MIINIRGTNGSGKTTLVKKFIDSSAITLNIAEYPCFNRAGVQKGTRFVTGTFGKIAGIGEVATVGSYKTACGGMDSIPNFSLARQAIVAACDRSSNVLAEGILASTVYGSWAEFANLAETTGRHFIFAYLRTPVKVCLERIQARNGGKLINEKLVHDKVRAIEGTRKKAIQAGHRVVDLPFGEEEAALRSILLGNIEAYRAR